MTKSQVEVITSVERRRRWTAAEKERIVAASLEPGAVVSALAREAGIHPSQLYGWRRQLCARPQAAPAFAAVRIAAAHASATALATTTGVIDIEFATGARMRITGPVDGSTLSAAVVALTRRERGR
jgi:transposase